VAVCKSGDAAGPVEQNRNEVRLSEREVRCSGVELDKSRAAGAKESCPAATSSRRAWGNRCGMTGQQEKKDGAKEVKRQ